MPDAQAGRVPELLCDAATLVERGDAVLFEVLEHGQRTPAFALRVDGQVHAYLNRCAHVPVEMDWQPGRFWDADKAYLVCAVHGALYHPATGQCVSGPCPGKRLQALDAREHEGRVYWYPSQRFQPVPA